MSGRSSLLVLVALIAVGAVLYFVFVAPGATPTVDTPDAGSEVERETRTPSEVGPRNLVVAAGPETNAPPAEPTPETMLPSAEGSGVDTTPRSAPLADVSPTGAHAPEKVRMGTVNWHRAPAMNVVNEILRETGLRLEASQDAQKVLDRARVTLNLENKSAAYVLGMVLLPHSLGFTVREDRLLIFVEDD